LQTIRNPINAILDQESPNLERGTSEPLHLGYANFSS